VLLAKWQRYVTRDQKQTISQLVYRTIKKLNGWRKEVKQTKTIRLGSDNAPIFSAQSVSARWCTRVRFRARTAARGNVPTIIKLSNVLDVSFVRTSTSLTSTWSYWEWDVGRICGKDGFWLWVSSEKSRSNGRWQCNDGRYEPTCVGWEDCEGEWLGWGNEMKEKVDLTDRWCMSEWAICSRPSSENFIRNRREITFNTIIDF